MNYKCLNASLDDKFNHRLSISLSTNQCRCRAVALANGYIEGFICQPLFYMQLNFKSSIFATFACNIGFYLKPTVSCKLHDSITINQLIWLAIKGLALNFATFTCFWVGWKTEYISIATCEEIQQLMKKIQQLMQKTQQLMEKYSYWCREIVQ